MYNLNIAIAALYAEVVCIVYSTSVVVVVQEKLSFGSSSITTRILRYKSLN